MNIRAIPTLLIIVFTLLACTVNPVTGERQFQIYGSDWEKQVGAQMYAPLKQAQGGEFILDPELTAYVQSVGERLARQAVRQEEFDYEFSVINDSTPNAWALPGGKIVVNRGLLAELGSEAELAAVLGHEIVHADAAHGARQQSTGMLAQIGAVAGMVVLGTKVENPQVREIAMLVPTVGAQLIMQRYGRDAERESDEYGMRYMAAAGYDPRGAVDLQRTFVELSKDRRDDWLTGLFASHPPSAERVENNIETAAQLPAGGETGRERYLRKTAYIRRLEPAYEAYEEAGKALAEENFPEAQRKLDVALRMEPREALFHAMQGDIYKLRGRTSQALRSYERTVQANPNLFYGHLRKGLMEYERDRERQAAASLKRSIELLPTSEAYYTLGLIEKSRGNSSQAAEYFSQAAQSQSRAGKAAQAELVRLDLRQNPSRYIASQFAQDTDGTVWMLIGNQTQVPITGIEVSYAWVDDAGRTREDRYYYRGTLGAGQQDRIRLNVRIPQTQNLQNRFRAGITGAQIAE